MKKQRFAEEQIIGVLRGHEAGAKAADLVRRHRISEATLSNWKAKYDGPEVSEARRLRALEEENAKLKRLLADTMLDASATMGASGKKLVRPAAKREAVAFLNARFQMSKRRAFCVIAADRKMVRYQSRRSPEPVLRAPLRELANERRLSPPVRPAAPRRRAIRDQSDYRLYREEGLTVRKRKARQRAIGTHTVAGGGQGQCPLVTRLRP